MGEVEHNKEPREKTSEEESLRQNGTSEQHNSEHAHSKHDTNLESKKEEHEIDLSEKPAEGVQSEHKDEDHQEQHKHEHKDASHKEHHEHKAEEVKETHDEHKHEPEESKNVIDEQDEESKTDESHEDAQHQQEKIEEKKEEIVQHKPHVHENQEKKEIPIETKPKRERKPLKHHIIAKHNAIKDFYDKKYKKLIIVPVILLILAIALIGVHVASTGDFVRKDVSLKGGKTITIQKEADFNSAELEAFLNTMFPQGDIQVRVSSQFGNIIGLIIDGTEDIDPNEVIKAIEPKIGKINPDEFSVASMGSSLGASFFKETLKAIFISFLFMGIIIFWYFGENTKIKALASLVTVAAAFLIFAGNQSFIKDIIAYALGIYVLYIYFKNSLPSFVVILNVFSDIVITLAVINLLGVKLSTAGIAAFLMIIGYSVDTNILLSTKLLKRKEGSLMERLFSAMKTGLTMSITTSSAIIVALIFTQSAVIKQIMIILLVGLIIDTINTWLLNAGLLRMYIEKIKGHRHGK